MRGRRAAIRSIVAITMTSPPENIVILLRYFGWWPYIFSVPTAKSASWSHVGPMGLFRLFRPTSYLLPFGTSGRHTQARASPPPQPVASWPHHHHRWLSTSRWSAGRYLERFLSGSRAFLERSSSVSSSVLGHFGPVSSDFSAAALYSAHPSPPFVVPMVLVR